MIILNPNDYQKNRLINSKESYINSLIFLSKLDHQDLPLELYEALCSAVFFVYPWVNPRAIPKLRVINKTPFIFESIKEPIDENNIILWENGDKMESLLIKGRNKSYKYIAYYKNMFALIGDDADMQDLQDVIDSIK